MGARAWPQTSMGATEDGPRGRSSATVYRMPSLPEQSKWHDKVRGAAQSGTGGESHSWRFFGKHRPNGKWHARCLAHAQCWRVQR